MHGVANARDIDLEVPRGGMDATENGTAESLRRLARMRAVIFTTGLELNKLKLMDSNGAKSAGKCSTAAELARPCDRIQGT